LVSHGLRRGIGLGALRHPLCLYLCHVQAVGMGVLRGEEIAMAEKTLRLPRPAPSAQLAWWQHKGTRSLIGRTLAFLLAFLGALAFLVPFLWAVSTSLKPSYQVFKSSCHV